jgi:arsenate reductase (thioredoxin)
VSKHRKRLKVLFLANENCPMWLSGKAKVVHVGFDDPPTLTKGAKTKDEALAHYRRVRDEIRAFVESLPHCLPHRPRSGMKAVS